MAKLIQPTVFNIITIAALLFCLVQVLTSLERTMSATTEAVQLIVEHAPESDAVDETSSLRLAADQEWRLGLNNSMSVTAVIAILANILANYLGRRRHRMNHDRIRQLEAELRGLRSRRSSSEG